MPDKPYILVCSKCLVEFRWNTNRKRLCPKCYRFNRGEIPYPKIFYKNRAIVLVRDENMCQCCGCMSDGKSTNSIVVHHIDTDRGNNSLSNLISLCNQCHLSLHGRYSDKILRRSNIYKLFAKEKQFGEFGKNLIYGASKLLVKRQFTGKPKLFFNTKK